MKNFLRISLFVVVLVGGAFASKIWVTREFTAALRPLDEVFQSTISRDTVQNQEASALLALHVETATTTEQEDNFSFVSPVKNAVLYQGCTYQINWTASSTINKIGFVLFDASTRKALSEQVSNLNSEISYTSIKNVNWKVGTQVLPGEYFLQLRLLNNQEKDEKGYRFKVEAYPDGSSAEQASLCGIAGGKL